MTIAVWRNLFTVGKELFNNSPTGAYANPPSISYLDEPYRLLNEASPCLPWFLPNKATSPSAVQPHPKSPIAQQRASSTSH